MTDPPSPPSETPQPAAPALRDVYPPRKRSPYGRERMAVGVVFFAITGTIAVYGAIQVHKDTFRVPPATHAIASCSAEIAALHSGFARELAPVRGGPDGALSPFRPLRDGATVARLAALDEDLLALRPFCEREGGDAMRAYTALTLWRHQAQDLSNLEERMLTPDAERALRYRSPPPSVAPPGTSP